MGIMCWSPPLDKLGNSVRGIQFCTVTSALSLWFPAWRLQGSCFCLGSKLKFKDPPFINKTSKHLCLEPLWCRFFQDLVSLCNFHNYDNLRHFAKKLDPRREGGDQRVSLLRQFLSSSSSKLFSDAASHPPSLYVLHFNPQRHQVAHKCISSVQLFPLKT